MSVERQLDNVSSQPQSSQGLHQACEDVDMLRILIGLYLKYSQKLLNFKHTTSTFSHMWIWYILPQHFHIKRKYGEKIHPSFIDHTFLNYILSSLESDFFSRMWLGSFRFENNKSDRISLIFIRSVLKGYPPADDGVCQSKWNSSQ